MMRAARVALLAGVIASLAGCETGGAGREAAPPVRVPSPPQPAPPPSGPLAPGFAPHALEGRAGGSIAASTRRPECAGHVAPEPSHTIELAREMHLALRATSERDVTLLVQAPDGAWLCNDDFDGLQPAIARTFGGGAVRVWVGTWDPLDAGSPYSLAISAERDPALPAGEPVIDRLNAVCAENWCAGSAPYRFVRAACDETCRVSFELDGATHEVVLEGASAAWRDGGLDEEFVAAIGPALERWRAARAPE